MDHITPFQEPENKKQILTVIDNKELLDALIQLANQENAQVRSCRPNTPDIIVFSACVKIIDREYLGIESWKNFCEYLEDVNYKEPVLQEEKGIYDDTPIIIVDVMEDSEDYSKPECAIGAVRYIEQSNIEEIIEASRYYLKKCNITAAPIKAEEDGHPKFKGFNRIF